jgi:hypothetical protein
VQNGGVEVPVKLQNPAFFQTVRNADGRFTVCRNIRVSTQRGAWHQLLTDFG